jgi:V8-like Glu-specific endopeptidase
MHRSKSAAAAALLSILALLPLAAAPVAAGDTKSNAKAEQQRVLEYWTAERIASAKPRDFIKTADGKFVPKAKPGGGGGGGSVTGASWTQGGPVVGRTGKVLFTMGGSNWVCSASVINDSRPDYSLVLTAGHCAYDETTGQPASMWTYVPSFDTAPTFTCAQSTHGCWTAVGLVADSGYAYAGSFNTRATVHDFAVAIVGEGSNGTQLDANPRGSYPIAYPGISTGDPVHSFGYPAAGRYKGKDLTYCSGPTFNDASNGNLTWGIACNMTGGSSGGPWLGGFTAAGAGTLTSLNSYGYGGISNMYGPKFNGNTQAVYDRANSTTGSSVVTVTP